MDTAFTATDLTADKAIAAVRDGGFELGDPEPVVRTLLDTFDGRLHRAGLRVELRELPESGTRELVLGGRDAVTASIGVESAPVFATDFPPGPLRQRLLPVLDVRALLPQVTMRATRTVAVQRDRAGKATATLTVHDGIEVERHPGQVPTCVVEVAELAGYARAAEHARTVVAAVGATPLDGDALDAVVAALGVDLAGYEGSPTVPLDPGTTALDAWRAVLANLLDAIDANWQGTIDAVDAEFLHDLRVAVRRTRSVIGLGAAVLPADVRSVYADAFKWLGTVTTPSRDLDVYVLEWDTYVAPLDQAARDALAPVVAYLADRRESAHRQLAVDLRSEHYATLVHSWRGWLDAPEGAWPSVDEADAVRPIADVATERIVKAQRRMLKRGRRITEETPGEELHELRKDAKKLRYLLECFGGLFSPKELKAFVKRLKSLQDNLGEHQDAEVHVAELREISEAMHGDGSAGAGTLLAMGQLAEHLDHRRRAAREEFAGRFAEYDSAPTQAALDALLVSRR